MDTAVVIVAAGRGARAAGGAVPKQYRLLGGKAVLSRAISGFYDMTGIGEIVVVIHEDDRDLYGAVVEPFGDRLLEPVIGGLTRQASVRAGLERLRQSSPKGVLIHDAARPFPSAPLIERVRGALGSHEGAVPALPVTDTIKQVEGETITATVDRSNLWRAQTPQGFDFEAILEAHNRASAQGRTNFTDDASLAEWSGLDVVIVEGDGGNMKITTDDDFVAAEAKLRDTGQASAGEFRAGHGFDVHAFGPGDHVTLCGVRVPHDRSLSGHSDADVALHALTDALLGTIADGDIGAHFPPSDPQWKGAASDAFLKDAAARIYARGGVITNVDVTIICEQPKIGPHRDAMRSRIADILQIGIGRVSVKATTTEGLGFTGRGEGIAAQAAAMVRF